MNTTAQLGPDCVKQPGCCTLCQRCNGRQALQMHQATHWHVHVNSAPAIGRIRQALALPAIFGLHWKLHLRLCLAIGVDGIDDWGCHFHALSPVPKTNFNFVIISLRHDSHAISADDEARCEPTCHVGVVVPSCMAGSWLLLKF